jgi:hypothetical protein
MTDNKTLYQTLKEHNLILNEKYLVQPERIREKVMGFMWEGEIEVTLKDNLRTRFYFWHHCYNDNGESWYPSQTELDSFWTPRFVPKVNSESSELVDAAWHLFKVGTHFYISKIGTFSSSGRLREEILKSIQDGTWAQDSDLWMLI